jgi:hypothetical protein
MPPDPTKDIRIARAVLDQVRKVQSALDAARVGWWYRGERRPSADRLRHATAQRVQAEQILARDLDRRTRRHWRADRAAQPFRDKLETVKAETQRLLDRLDLPGAEGDEWVASHPGALERLDRIEHELDDFDAADRLTQRLTLEVSRAPEPPMPTQEISRELDLEMDLGL